MKSEFKDAFGSVYFRKVNKSEGLYQKISNKRDIEYLLQHCKGWKQITFYGNTKL